MAKSFLKLTDIHVYKVSSELSDYIWNVVSAWDVFNRQTLGIQYVKAVDSIAGNIAEGFGRYHKKDKQKFYYNARGSIYESIHWTEKAKIRNLIKKKEYDLVLEKLNNLPKEINWLIKITEEKLTI